VSTTPSAADQRAGFADRAAYWPIVIGVYFLVGVLFFYSGKGKLFDQDGHAPPALKKQFEGTFIDKVPGVDTAWVVIHRAKGLLLVALALALLNFACLSFGQTSTGTTEGTASLYMYFGATAVIILLVLRLPPNGPPGWLGRSAGPS
jgi:hypothetical protein